MTDTDPQRIGGCNCDWLEAENRKLWRRAAQADYEHVQADLRVARLRLVLGATLRALAGKRHFQAAELQRWQRVWEDDQPTTTIDVAGFYIGSDSRDDSAHWACVTHEPCGTDVFSGEQEPKNPDMGVIWAAMAAHRCPDADGGCDAG